MIKKITALLLLISLLIVAGCTTEVKTSVSIISTDGSYTIAVGETQKLHCLLVGTTEDELTWTSSSSCVEVTDSGYLIGMKAGIAIVTATAGDAHDSIKVIVTSKTTDQGKLTISAPKNEIAVGEKIVLDAELITTLSHLNEESICFKILDGQGCATLNGRELIGTAPGTVTLVANAENIVSDPITLRVLGDGGTAVTDIRLRTDKDTLSIGEFATLSYTVTPEDAAGTAVFEVISGKENVKIDGNKVYALTDKESTIVCKIGNIVSNTVIINKTVLTSDPYIGITASEFYADYQPADSYLDAYYRSQHGFMSGSIAEQDQEPTISVYRPQENGLYIKNSNALYSEDGNVYYIVNSYGEVVNEIYKGGGYVILEEVAAYLMAFGDIPANYSQSKNTKPTSSPWGEYLRVNHTKFSGDTNRYPYEPELPDISGCGGSLTYYELDIGTTGNDCDPSYRPAVYNNGNKITRGASRIVYARFSKNGNITKVSERYLFYTYNHYNDFQEYLNYEGGWGEMFGNITGGGTLSSKKNYNPTPYVKVALSELHGGRVAVSIHPIVYTILKKEH